jgi:hypothetical protein
MKEQPTRLTPFEKKVLEIGVALYVVVARNSKFNLPAMRENSPGHRIRVAFLKRMKTAKQRAQILLSCLTNLPEIPDFDIPVTSQFMMKLARAWQEGKPLPFSGIEFYLLRNWDCWDGTDRWDGGAFLKQWTDELRAFKSSGISRVAELPAPPLKWWTDECVAQLLNNIASDSDLAIYRSGKHGELTVDTYRKIRARLVLNPLPPPLVRQFKVDSGVIVVRHAKPPPKTLSLLRQRGRNP